MSNNDPRKDLVYGRTEDLSDGPAQLTVRVEDKGDGTARLVLDQTLPWPAVLAVLDTLKRVTGQIEQ